MDPDENLQQQLELAKDIVCSSSNASLITSTASDESAYKLAGLVEELDEHLSKGGELPEEWDDSMPNEDVIQDALVIAIRHLGKAMASRSKPAKKEVEEIEKLTGNDISALYKKLTRKLKTFD